MSASEEKYTSEKGVGDDFAYGSARKGGKQYLEDAFFSFSSANNKIFIASVFDGHGGYNGMVAAATAREFSLDYFRKNSSSMEEWNVEDWKSKFVKLFSDIHIAIRERFIKSTSPTDNHAGREVDSKGIVRNINNGDPIHGGSTGTVVALIHESDGSSTAICANVGDSVALWAPLKPGQEKYRFLCVDHGPDNVDEFRRIQQLPSGDYPTKLLFVYDKSNVYKKYECPKVFLDDGRKDPTYTENPWGHGLHPTNVRYEPGVYAVSPKAVSKDTTCIAMTRALGDFYAEQFGLSHVPDVTIEKFEAGAEYVLTIASDGIWDCYLYEDWAAFVAQKVASYSSTLSAIVESSLDETVKRAISNFGSKAFDDCALVIVPSPKVLSRLPKA